MPGWIDAGGDRRRRQPRVEVRLECLLTRQKGSPINGHTIDLGPGGMRVATDRPLGVDELLHFDLPLSGGRVDGDARVLREQSPNVYALRFEAVPEHAAQRLDALASG